MSDPRAPSRASPRGQDIVERLRKLKVALTHPDIAEAADEIERLRRELRSLRQDDGAVIAGLQGDIKRLTMQVDSLNRALCKSGDEKLRLEGNLSEVIRNAKLMDEEIERLRAENRALEAVTEQLKAKLDQAKKDELITALEMLKAVVKDEQARRR